MFENTKLCQSCGKILKNNHGTDKNSKKSDKFCINCYYEGEFTQNLTLEEMEYLVSLSLSSKPIPSFVKKNIINNLKNLDRWRP
ncbi:zinc ribbon domain-containing protein [Staphylococcus epidermidis]|nr:zinc ribbon domain-containing protein [Staphylococcus epidermidis]MCG2405761.1 zinc ribbon domain-containing protein [Staphylococcus epidermidis]